MHTRASSTNTRCKHVNVVEMVGPNNHNFTFCILRMKYNKTLLQPPTAISISHQLQSWHLIFILAQWTLVLSPLSSHYTPTILPLSRGQRSRINFVAATKHDSNYWNPYWRLLPFATYRIRPYTLPRYPRRSGPFRGPRTTSLYTWRHGIVYRGSTVCHRTWQYPWRKLE